MGGRGTKLMRKKMAVDLHGEEKKILKMMNCGMGSLGVAPLRSGVGVGQ